MNPRCCLIPLLAACMAVPAAVPYPGLSGAALMEALRADNSPALTLTHDNVFEALDDCDAAGGGVIVNRFDDTVLTVPLISSGTWVNVLPGSWWTDPRPGLDLHNIVAAPYDVPALMGDYPPGDVTDPAFDNGVWSVGVSLIGTAAVGFYMPPHGCEGDFARSALYVVTLYGGLDVVDGNSFNFISMSRWPGINGHSLRQLLAWHDADPVDASERRRDAAVAARQGNHNPYVVDPALVRRVFEPDNIHDNPVTPGDPSGPEVKAPLRGVYSMSDRYIYLTSPYVAADAVWSVDGVPVPADRVSTADLGVGRHTLSFKAAGLEGSLIIEIKP